MYKVLLKHKDIKSESWKRIIESNQFSNPFQSEEFFIFFNSLPNQMAEVFAVESEGEIVSLCVVTIQKEKGLKGYFTRRAIIYGGPIFLVDKTSECELLINTIYDKLRKEVIYIEIRNFNDYSAFNSIFHKNKWSFIRYLNYEIHIQDKAADDVLNEMKYNRRREINMSFKNGATYYEALNIDEVRDLYKILKDLYIARVKLPLPDLVYFENLFHSTIGKVFVVKHEGKIIGGSFCFYYPNKNIYTIYYCGIRNYHKKIFPTHLAIYSAIEFGIKNNLKIVDLMGAGKEGEVYGVRNYKAEFSGTLVKHGRYLKVCNPLMYNLGKLCLMILKK